MSIWSLGKLFESLRWQGLAHGLGHYNEIFGSKSAYFVASQSIYLSKEINDICYEKEFGVKRPFRAVLYISHVGRTSFTLSFDLFDDQSGLKLGSNMIVLVRVDKTIRKPVTLPINDFKNVNEYLQKIINGTIDRTAMPIIPSTAFQHKIKALHSDSDMNGHVTQTTYPKWCSDAAAMGAHKGHFSYFKKHIDLYPLKCMEFHFIGETAVNDIVTVHVWEGEIRMLQCAVLRRGQVIFSLIMEFYDGQPTVVPPHLTSKL